MEALGNGADTLQPQIDLFRVEGLLPSEPLLEVFQ